MREQYSLRNRAALCHLAALPVLTSVWLPMLLRKADIDDDFLYCHATGAAVYQGGSLVTFGLLWLGRNLPYAFLDEISGGLVQAFLGIIACCLLGIYMLGAVGLALQAWNSDAFYAPGVNWLLGFDTPSEV